ncbi:Catechol 2,3-dioxygenase [Mucilaginibacter mallensis]|uniref:Catechol 2,3-dioxygenase n=1 Tax=Mucilaginibacter mallensis TaxID=652787 RepID=A0A1H1VWZ8_MUCMA|nr:VOC family protein [Mucilaginibacter mallensis]SDS89414.1 Catechol 2,3-dioxygenase [Mucilaginibacter mallensis]
MKFIEVVSIPVSDQQVAKEFYLKIGFELIIEAPMGDGSTWLQLGLAGQATSISLVTWFKNIAPGSSQGLVLYTDDIEKEVAELRAKGITMKDIDPTPWGKFSEFSDPDGNSMVLRQP